MRLSLLLGVLFFLLWFLWSRSKSFNSRQGVVNAAIITVHAPLEGKLTLDPLEPGEVLDAGTAVGKVENPLNPQIVTDRQTIISQIKTIEGQIQSLTRRIDSRQSLLAQFQGESSQQGGLQKEFQVERVAQLEKDLEAAKSAARAANLEAQRYRFLYENGAITLDLADQTKARAEQADAVVQRQEAALSQAKTEQRATNQGLQLEGSKVFSYPDIRVRELAQEITDLSREQEDLTVTLAAKQQELSKISQQLDLAQFTPIKVPITGVLWSLTRNNTSVPEHINAGDPILQMLDCANVWVDAFVGEQKLEEIKVGDRVNVRFLSDLQGTEHIGRITSVRSGIGRSTPGEDVAVPPPEMVRREIAVRVRVENVKMPESEFCGVGRSVEVTFLTPD